MDTRLAACSSLYIPFPLPNRTAKRAQSNSRTCVPRGLNGPAVTAVTACPRANRCQSSPSCESASTVYRRGDGCQPQETHILGYQGRGLGAEFPAVVLSLVQQRSPCLPTPLISRPYGLAKRKVTPSQLPNQANSPSRLHNHRLLRTGAFVV
jgi:hypothetical protein